VIISPEELIVDNFAGGGGASVGIQMATGRAPDLAINHDPEALALYRANHPSTRTLCEDVFTVVPREVVAGRPVGLLWASPDCTFFSKARGGKPHRDRNRARKRRGLAGVVLKWAAQVKPRMIFVENVEEFRQWGPLGPDGQPCPKRKGQSFRRWQARLLNLGYEVESRELRACDFGAPTSRRRLFIIARCDGQPITWPEATHGPGRAAPYRTAAECIDWSIPCPSIFGRKKPLAVATQRRIARGIVRYVVNAAAPFIVPITHAGGGRAAAYGDLRATGGVRADLAGPRADGARGTPGAGTASARHRQPARHGDCRREPSRSGLRVLGQTLRWRPQRQADAWHCG
jgi:DNA (cytosine-5)-methyltransferase 1